MSIFNANISTSYTTAFISSGNSIVRTMHLCNQSTSAAAIDVYLVPNGSSPAATNAIYKNLNISPGDTYIASKDEKFILADGDLISMSSNSADAIVSTFSYTSDGVGFPLNSFMNAQTDGLYFDFTKTDRFFQEFTGQALADDVGEAIGLGLDQRTWGGQTLAEVLAGQTELVTAGSWLISVVGGTTTAVESPAGTITVTGDGSNQGRADQSFPTVIGRQYALTLTVEQNAFAISFSNTQGGASLSGYPAGVVVGTTTFFFTATATTTWVRLFKSGATTSVAKNISCKLVPGNHAVQSSSSLRPLRQTTGAKFDGSDDNLLTNYTAGSGANFIVALVDVPATLSTNHFVAGTQEVNGRFYLGFNPQGSVVGGVGEVGANIIFSTNTYLGQSIVIGLSANAGGAAYRLFAADAVVFTGAASNGPNTITPFRIGSGNPSGTAASFFPGSIKKIVVGREFLTLERYLQIRNEMLTF